MNNRWYEWTLSGSKSIFEFKKQLADYRAQGKKIVTANGCFDIFHFGHLSLLREAKASGDILIVGVNSDRTVKKIKGAGRPIFPEKERASLLVSLEYVDHVIVFDEILPNELLETIRPDIHCISGEYAKKKLPEKDIVEKSGGEIKVLPYISGHSTSNIIQKINHQKIDPGSQSSSNKGVDAITDYLFESSQSIRCLAYQHGGTLMRISSQMVNTIKSNGKIIFCGDGESGAAMHYFVAELIGRFSNSEKPFPAITLSDEFSDISDHGDDDVFSRQLKAIGKLEYLLVAISTSGESKKILMAGETARDMGMQIIAFTGNAISPLTGLCDEMLSIDSNKTPIVQQGLITAFHGICKLMEDMIQ
jgi:rfaE bifunctional protein nucleotidyltransferase chain/domain